MIKVHCLICGGEVHGNHEPVPVYTIGGRLAAITRLCIVCDTDYDPQDARKRAIETDEIADYRHLVDKGWI